MKLGSTVLYAIYKLKYQNNGQWLAQAFLLINFPIYILHFSFTCFLRINYFVAGYTTIYRILGVCALKNLNRIAIFIHRVT